MIDVGGAALLGAAARNAAGVAAVADPAHYPTDRRRDPRARASAARSCGRASRPRRSARSPPTTRRSPPTSTRSPATCSRAGWRIVLEKVDDLRYGENPHQRAAFYRETTHRSATLADAGQLQGGRPSFNNLLDLDAAYRIARDYTAPTVAIVKHTDPVGLASHDELVEAYRHALETDPVASFGGIVGREPRARRGDGPRDRRQLVRGGRRPGLQPGGDRHPAAPSRGLELLAVPPDPTDGMRDYGIANLDFKRVAGGLLVEDLDDLGPGPRPPPGRDQAPTRRWRS